MDTDEPIAIVGVGCQFPGANNLDEFWRLLVNGENHVNEIPKERWNLDHYYDPNPDTPNKTYVRRAGLIDGHDEWDNRFYGISTAEAEQIDPQQRLVMDCVHMALEDGGITKTKLNGTYTGVYIGVMNDDYRGAVTGDGDHLDHYTLTGSSPSIASARVSYHYNLLGPAITIDTACSSALVAIHLAAQALKTGDCKMAICGGVNSILYPEIFIPLSKARMVSPSGQCQAFSKNANGYARGEGCGIVVLKPLSMALADNDHIWATVMTGCNQDGHTATPITAPSVVMQGELLKKMYGQNNIDPKDIQYIEAHGTGTPTGDPVEATALGQFFHREGDNRIYVGSVKTNIAHLESAAGSAGLVKVLLMMKNGKFVPSLHVTELNPAVPFEKFGMKLVQEVFDWDEPENGSRMACVNCFGFGGTNSHAILKQYKNEQKMITENGQHEYVMTVSAEDPISLEKNLNHFIHTLDDETVSLSSLSYTSALRRDHYIYRTLFFGSSREDFKTQMKAKLEDIEKITPAFHKIPRVVFVFCGVGTTWQDMCKDLLVKVPVFADTVRKIDDYLEPLVGWSIYEKLMEGEDVSDPFLGHLSIFTCQVGLSAVWQQWGIVPDAIVGQSVGEVAAAYASGSLSLKDAVHVIYHRSLMLSKEVGGSMIVVRNCETSDLEELCSGLTTGKVNIAVYSSPVSSTVSGDTDAINELKEVIEQRNAELSADKRSAIIQLGVKCAYHSHHMETASKNVENSISYIEAAKPLVPFYSTVLGERTEEPLSAEYWGLNVKNPVLFYQALTKAKSENNSTIYVEIGPRPVMKAHAQDIFSESNVHVLPSVTNKDEVGTLYQAFKTLYGYGVDPSWKNLVPVVSPLKVPKYQFNKVKHLFESDTRKLKSQGKNLPEPLVVPKPGDGNAYKVSLNTVTTRYVYDHFVQGSTIVPGALHGEIALELGQNVFECPSRYIKVSFQITSLIALNGQQSCTLDITTTNVDKTNSFQFETRNNGNICAKGTVTKIGEAMETKVDIKSIKTDCESCVTASTLYGGLKQYGFEYGPLMRNCGNIYHCSTHCLAEINPSEDILKGSVNSILHPAIIDAMWHSSLPLLSGLGEEGIEQFEQMKLSPEENKNQENQENENMMSRNQQYMQNAPNSERRLFPVGPGNLVVKQQTQEKMYCYTIITQEEENAIFTNALLLNADGSVIAEMTEIEHRFVDNSEDVDSFSYEVNWKPLDSSSDATLTSDDNNWLVVSFSNQVAKSIGDVLPGTTHAVVSETIQYPNHELFAELKHYANNTETLNGLIFAPGGRSSINQTPLEVTRFMRNSSLLLLEILKIFAKTGVPMMVVTENTQCHRYAESDEVNILGSELWGIVRSVVKETSEIQVVLIDVLQDIEVSSENLKDVILKVSAQSIDCIEISVGQKGIYTNEFQGITKKGRTPTHRNNVYDDNCRIELRTQHVKTLEKPFFTLQENEVIQTTDKKALVSLDEAVIQDAMEHPLTQQYGKGKTVVWPHDNEEGYNVVSLETRGKTLCPRNTNQRKYGSSMPNIVTEDSRGMKKLKPKKKKKSRNVIACYPVVAATTVSIPTSCICRSKDLPSYSPGLLINSVICWNLVQHIHKRTPVCIVTSDKESSQVKLLVTMLESKAKRCNVIVLSDTELNGIEESNTKVVILMSEEMPRELSDVLESSPKVKKILGMKTCLSAYQTRELREKRSDLKIIALEMEEIFDPPKLELCFPKVRKWLKKNKKSLKTRKYDGHYRTVPMSSKLAKSLSVRVPTDMLFRPDCAYVIIGALSGLGWELLQILAAMGAGIIITMSRRELSEENANTLQNIEQIYGVRIVHLSADICNLLSLKRAFSEFLALNPGVAIKGVFNGAGVIDDGLYTEMTPEKFEKAFYPKVLGTWNLHTATRDFPLDYFMMHSSIASVLGNAGQTNYAAGNSFLDTMAHYRRSLGLPAQTINWGALTVGMAEDKTLQDYLASIGFLTLDVENIRSCFMDSLIKNKTQITYSNFDWATIVQLLLTTSKNDGFKARLKGMIEKYGKKGAFTMKGQSVEGALDLEEFNNLTEEEKFIKLNEIIANVLGEILTIDPSVITAETDIIELGLDSQRAMELISRLFAITYCRIPFVLVMSGENRVKDLVGYLIENIPTGADTEAVVSKPKENVKGALTYMEYYYYERYLKNPNDPSLSFVIDFQLSVTLSNPDIWRKLIHGIMKLHPELRVLHKPIIGTRTRFQVSKVVLPPEKAILDFRLVGKEDLLVENGIPKNWSLCKFNPRTDLPMRVLYQKGSLQDSLRLVFNNIFSDLNAIWVLLGDIQKNLPSFMMHKKITAKASPVFDVAEMMEFILQVETPLLEKFWDAQMEKCKEVITLSNDKTSSYSFNRGYIKGEMPDNLLDNLKSYCASKNITPFHVLCSLYQLILHKISGQQAVSISTVVDMRMHFPEIATRFVNGRNYIPLVAEFTDPDESLDDIISRNSGIIKKSIFHGMYPTKLLSDRHGKLDEITRHRIVFDDYSRSPKQTGEVKGFYMKMKNIYGGDYNNETKLVMIDYQDSLKLELQYDRDLVDKDTANKIVDCLYYLLEHALYATDKNVDKMFPGGKLPLTYGHVANKDTSNKNSALFKKQTKHGWDHDVQLSLQYYREDDKTHQRIVWKTTSGKNTTKILPLSMITEIREIQINGVPCMVIQTRERKFIFKSAQNGLVSSWVQNLMNAMNNLANSEVEKHNNSNGKATIIDKTKKMKDKQKAIMDDANGTVVIDKTKKTMDKQKAIMEDANSHVEKVEESNGKEVVVLTSEVPEDTDL